jgi:hypothetical protein
VYDNGNRSANDYGEVQVVRTAREIDILILGLILAFYFGKNVGPGEEFPGLGPLWLQ